MESFIACSVAFFRLGIVVKFVYQEIARVQVVLGEHNGVVRFCTVADGQQKRTERVPDLTFCNFDLGPGQRAACLACVIADPVGKGSFGRGIRGGPALQLLDLAGYLRIGPLIEKDDHEGRIPDRAGDLQCSRVASSAER